VNSTRLKPIVGLLVLAIAALAVSSCASMRASQARTAHIHQQTRNHVYDMPCQQVWPTARQLLFSEGYAVKDTGEGTTMTLETEWATTTSGTTESSARYLVQGIEPADGQCQVNFTKNTQSANSSPSSSRDLDIEWRLMQEADPDAAAAIRADADVKAQAAASAK
jgi:hypothetical protein